MADPRRKFKTTPYAYQLTCLNRFGKWGAFALLAEMGTGKTWIIINNIADLWAAGNVDSVLVLAPDGVHTNWVLKEIPKHMPDWVRMRCAAWSSTAKRKDKQALENLFSVPYDGEVRILTMNWEALQTKRGFEFAEKFSKASIRLMIVCDESDAIKNPSAARTKALLKLKPYSAYRRIMTGTPINNAPFDAFAQFNFLDESILQTTSFYAFKAEYAQMLQPGDRLLDAIKQKAGTRFTPQVVARDNDGKPIYRNLDRLAKLIDPYCFRVLKKDCLDLPDKIYKTIYFDLTKEQNAIYKKAKEECRLVVADNTETSFNKLVSLMKLAQITSGYYTHEFSDGPVRIEGKNPKLNLLIDRVKKIIESGEKIIIWAKYRVEISDIVSLLIENGIAHVEYHGGVGKEGRVCAIDRFQTGDAQVFVGNQQAGGTGITLTAASYMIYFSNNFSLRDRLQSEDRAHRIGQTKNVTYINLAAKGTIDEVIIDALAKKKNIADQIVDRAASSGYLD